MVYIQGVYQTPNRRHNKNVGQKKQKQQYEYQCEPDEATAKRIVHINKQHLTRLQCFYTFFGS